MSCICQLYANHVMLAEVVTSVRSGNSSAAVQCYLQLISSHQTGLAAVQCGLKPVSSHWDKRETCGWSEEHSCLHHPATPASLVLVTWRRAERCQLCNTVMNPWKIGQWTTVSVLLICSLSPEESSQNL